MSQEPHPDLFVSLVREPALVHAKVIRPYSHSLSDDEAMYKPPAERENEASRDPVTQFPKWLVAEGYAEAHYYAPNGLYQDRLDKAQDNAITESMGHLFDRTKERLGASDVAIAQTRRRLIQAARRLREGHEPPGMNPADYRLRPYSVQLPRDCVSWPEAVAEPIDARPETFRASV